MKALSILLVEDDDGDAKAVHRALDKAKIANSVYRAVDGLDALEILRGQNGKEKLLAPFLLLVDINMPRMSGLDLVAELRKDPDFKKTVVFIITTSKRQQDKEAAYSLNVAGYIVKEDLGKDFEALSSLLDYYRLIVELPS